MCKLQISFVFYKHDRAATDGNSEFGHVSQRFWGFLGLRQYVKIVLWLVNIWSSLPSFKGINFRLQRRLNLNISMQIALTYMKQGNI